MAGLPMNFEIVGKTFFGLIPLRLGARALGGPFPEIKNTKFSVCLKAEARPAEYSAAARWLPIKDFSVPAKADRAKVEAVVQEALLHGIAGDVFSAGCMGGTGRTGLFFALVLKAAGYTEPVKAVRMLYKPHAVETEEQMAYVANFDVTGIQKAIQKSLVKTCLLRKLRIK